jgi:RNA polymerase sigma-70 factor (ECF subfamily)
MIEETDEQIVIRVQKGDTDSFGILVFRYEQKMLRYGKKFLWDAEEIQDLVQDVFMKAYMNIQSFDATRRFSPWLYRIAHNEFVNSLKKRKASVFNFFDFDTDILFPHPTASETTDNETMRRMDKEFIEKCLGEIDSKYREVLVLSYYEEFEYQEISEILHIPISTVGVRLRRAKEQLKKVYEKKYGTYE